MIRSLCSVVAVVFIAGCTYPSAMVEQGGNNASLYFPRAAAGMRVFLDGIDAGEALSFDGKKNVLGVQPGPHRVAVRQGAATVYDRQVYVGADSRVAIEVP